MAIALTLWMGTSAAQYESKTQTPTTYPIRVNQVYLMRGWLDVFSLGMDDLTDKLNQKGIKAAVYSHLEYYSLAEFVAGKYKAGAHKQPIIIVGHSVGADTAILMAARLQELNVPVRLIIAFDPVATHEAPRNVARVVNFFQSNNGWGAHVERGAGFRGNLNNVDIAQAADINHFNIDKVGKLHQQAIGYIQQALGSRTAPILASSTAAAPVPAAASAKPKTSDIEKSGNSKPAPTAASAKRPAPVSPQTPSSFGPSL
ncbi:MAG: hypothetical protein Q7S17_11580 [Xanthobacteraceae bacterium]|nr:hypothetical protein [Xanthobacteraceae bacterium]